MKVVFTPEAKQQADEMDTWWRAHRPKAPGLFAGELAEVRESIAGTPTLGVSTAHAAGRSLSGS